MWPGKETQVLPPAPKAKGIVDHFRLGVGSVWGCSLAHTSLGTRAFCITDGNEKLGVTWGL